MECLSSEETINNTFEIVRRVSYSEKKSKLATEEEIINKFLDKVLEFQKFLNDKSEIIEDINDRLEKLTWLNSISENDLMQINTLIGSAKDLLSVLIRQYINLNFLRKKGVAKEAIKRFKSSIDSLRENIEDLESIFFLLPQMPEFNETSKQLSLV